MAGEQQRENLNSRYLVRKSLGEYAPWRGYSVRDSLSEKEYLLFSLCAPTDTTVALDDLRMRDYLFSRGGGIISPALSLQRINGTISFLLGAAELVPLTKALPSMRSLAVRAAMKRLATEVLTRHRVGLHFHNLTPESLYVSNDSLGMLPTAYLLPREILRRIGSPRALDERYLDDLSVDLRMLAEILSHFTTCADRETAEAARRVSFRLRSLGPETPGAEYFGAVEELLALVGAEDRDELLPPLREFRAAPHAAPMRAMRQIAAKAREGERQVVLVRGESGEGTTRFLGEIARSCEGEWGMEPGEIVSDQTLFDDVAEREAPRDAGYCLIDDHVNDPILSCHIIDHICRAADVCPLVVLAPSAGAPEQFIEILREELAKHDVSIREVALPPFGAAEKLRILSQMVPRRDGAARPAHRDSALPLAIARCNIAAVRSDDSTPDGGAPDDFLSRLSAEERSVLNFIATFTFDVPLSFLLGIYAPEEANIYLALQRLVALGIVRTRAHVSALAGGALCVSYGVASEAISKIVTAAVPADRRRQIHGNIAHLLEEKRGVPALFSFYHLTKSGDRTEASLKGFEILELLAKRKRFSALACFSGNFMEEKLERCLPADIRYKLYLDLGTCFSLAGSMDRAETCFRRCREEASRDPEPSAHRSIMVEASRRECEILEKKGEFTKAEKLLEKVIAAHGETLPANERAKLYHDMAWIDYRLGAFDESWKNCLLVHRLLDEKRNPAEIAQAYNLMGTINWNRSKYDDAVLCYQRCLAIRQESGDESGIAVTYNNLGLVHLSLGSLEEALDCFTKSMDIKERHNNLPGLAAGHHNMALVYLDMDRIREAEKNCAAASRLAEEIGNQQLLAESYGTMGDIAFLSGNHEKAKGFYLKDLRLCDKTKSLREKAITCRRLGELALTEGKLPETSEMLAEARALNQKIGSRLETALLNLLEGRILLTEGKVEDGRSRLEGAVLELSLLGKSAAAAAVAAEIGSLHLGEGNEQLAREYLQRATALAGDGVGLPKQVQLLQDNLDRRSELTESAIATDADRFRMLCKVTSLLRTIREPAKLYEAVVETVRRATGMERAALIVRGDTNDVFRVVSGAGGLSAGAVAGDKNIGAFIAIARHLGYPIDSSRSEIPEGKVSSDFLARHPRAVCVPLRILGEVSGYLYLDSSRAGERTSDDDQCFLVALSQQLALAIEAAALAEKASALEKKRPHPAALARPKERITAEDVIGNSSAMRHIHELVENIKEMDTTVLLTGSNGTGKDLIAKLIHYGGPRAGRPFVALNCAAFSEELLESELFGHEKGSFTSAHRQRIGHFESANGGTIFLNEIGDLPLRLQPKLLGVLEERTFYRVGGTAKISTDVRIITATNADLRALVDQGRFREDLYHRINVFPIRMPDLRERAEDIEPLCAHFLSTYCRLYGIPVKKISPEAMTYLYAYSWPGNVRELENLVNRLIIISKRDTVLPEDLPDHIVRRPESARVESRVTLEATIDALIESIGLSAADPILPKVEGVIVNKVVEKVGDKTKAAALLGISKPTVYSKLRKYGKSKDS